MTIGVRRSGRTRDMLAGGAIVVWMLLFSILGMKTHYALSRLAAEVDASTAPQHVATLEARIVALERRAEASAEADTLSNGSSPDLTPKPVRRRMP